MTSWTSAYRVPRVRQKPLDLFLEGVGECRTLRGAHEGVLQQVVQAMAALAATEEDAQRLEGLDGQAVAAAEDRLVLEHVLGDPAGALDVLRVARVVRGDLALDARVGGAVDVVGVPVEGGQPAGDEGGAQPLGGAGQVVHRAEAAEALAEDRPGRAAGEQAADGLAVADDGVGAEEREVFGLLAGTAAQREGLPVGGRGVTGAALVEQQDAELFQGPAEPGLPSDETIRPEAGAALEVDQPGQLLPRLVARDDLAGEELDGLPVRAVVVEGHGEAVVGEDDTGLAVAEGQRDSRDVRISGCPS